MSSIDYELLLDRLNEGQRQAFDAIAAGQNIFLTGPGGTGKSFLIRLLYDVLPRKTGKSVALTALTGCASLLLHPKAKTVHSWAGIGLGREPVPLLVAGLRKSRRACLRWLQADVLVIDEISMMTPELFEKLDQVGRKIRRNEHSPFGGLQIIAVGDFYQLPPVVRQEGDEKVETSFVFESPLWKDLRFTTHELTQIERQKDQEFQGVLNEARRGELSKKSLKFLAKRMGLDYKDQAIQPTMLFTRRAQVDTINMSYLKKLTTERRAFKASTLFQPIAATAGLSQTDPFVQKAVAKLDNDAPYEPELIVAIGAQVMLLTNLDHDLGLVNGSRGVVVAYGLSETKEKKDDTPIDASLLVPIVQFRNGSKIPISHATWEVQDMPGVLRRQIPLKLAYAITIHRVQGATLDCALIDVGGKTFEYGQAYVALSRVKDKDSLYIHDLEQTAFRAHPKVKAFYETPLPKE
jgi:ATP-dependent DNA helicase PIF1